MNKICGIYKITSPTGKIYIGQSININKRFLKYKSNDCKRQPRLYYSLCKYGWDLHITEIICECEKSELNELEIFYIKQYNTFNSKHGLNLSSGGNTTIFTEESKQKISQKKLGIKRPLSFRKKLSKLKKGKIPHINCRHKPSEYEIYDNNDKLILKEKTNIKNKLKELNLPTYSFCKSYRENKKINKGKYKDWYVIKIIH